MGWILDTDSGPVLNARKRNGNIIEDLGFPPETIPLQGARQITPEPFLNV